MPWGLEYRWLRAPADDGEVLLEPAGGERLASMIEANAQRMAGCEISLHGRMLSDLARQARSELLADAGAYVRQYRDADGPNVSAGADVPRRLYLTGHQPELFHPGVWLKNFVLDRLARRDGAAAIHVLIDNDEARTAAVRVPRGSLAQPQIELVSLDADGPPRAWEHRRIQDRGVFLSFAERAAEAIAPLVDGPLVRSMWRQAPAALAASDNLGQCLAQLRHQTEAAWGLETLEVPLSHLCRGEPFCWLAAYLLAERARVRESYNRRLHEYRRLHRLRSRNHPVPDLAADDPWQEAPFWLFRDDGRRERLFVAQRGGSLLLSDRQSPPLAVSAPADGDAARLAADLMELPRRGVQLRPRALMTTLYLRVVLSDWFIHGIGGAKYDQVTDCLIADLWDIHPPGLMTVSGTRLLPVARPPAGEEDLRRIDRLLREIEFHPERMIDLAAIRDASERRAVRELIEEKRSLLAPPPLGEGRARHEAIARVNAALTAHVSTRRTDLLQQRGEVLRQQQACAVLDSREFAACLFPEADLRRWLLDAAGKAL